MRSVFKSLLSGRKALQAKIDKFNEKTDRETREDANAGLALYNELIDYMHTYEWLKKDSSKEKMKVYIESGFDYEVLMGKFNLSYDNAKTTVKWATKQFRQKIGENTVSLLQQGFPYEARASYETHTGKLKMENLIMSDLVDALPDEEYFPYSLEECKYELRVLYQYSKKKMESVIGKADLKKLAYIRHLIEGSSKRAELFRPYMFDVLEGLTSIDEIIEWEEDIKNQDVSLD